MGCDWRGTRRTIGLGVVLGAVAGAVPAADLGRHRRQDVPGMSDRGRLKIRAAAEQEEARFHADLERLGTERVGSMIAGLRASIAIEPDPLKRGILRGAYLASLRYVSEFWVPEGTGGDHGSSDEAETGGRP